MQDNKYIEISDLEAGCTYLVDFGKEVEFLKTEDINEYRVFGDIDVYLDDIYVGTLCSLPFSALY